MNEGSKVATDIANRPALARFRVLAASIEPEAATSHGEFAKGIAELRELREPRPICQALLAFGERLLEDGELERSEACATEALRITCEIGFPHREGEAELLLGSIALARRDWEPASRHLHVALGRARELGTPELESQTCAALADYQEALGRRARAVGWLGNAVRIFQRVFLSLSAHGELQDRYLAEPRRARLLETLEDWLQD